jgi:hypothetical protein
MHASNEVTTTVRELESVQSAPSVQPSAPVVPWWECEGITGPADLYKSFAFTAVEQALSDRGETPDYDMFDIIFQYVEIAVNVVLNAAAVPESWQSQYDAAVAGLIKEARR